MSDLWFFFSISRNPTKDDIYNRKVHISKTKTTLRPEGVWTDEFLSRKHGFLFSAMHSHAFPWFSAAPPVFLFLGFLPLQLNQIWQIFVSYTPTYGEEGGWTLFVCLQKLYLTDMFLTGFLVIFNFDNIFKRVIFLFGSCFSMYEVC
jgi:hypothetical protein